MTGHAVGTRGVLLAYRLLERTDEVERVIRENDVLILRTDELILARLVELAKQSPNVGRITCGGRTDTVQSGGDVGGGWRLATRFEWSRR